ncbi:hypothetical protein CDAR_33371 [Caerostris darwini]|uniref:Uncharacterized protein n=1 Tax=Caerostris darwini TaxID=1538125 RepID=A0AAV4VDN0_9ARAC|nr:hypothetical protein CDAR_33371 [Caerostris darwini]
MNSDDEFGINICEENYNSDDEFGINICEENYNSDDEFGINICEENYNSDDEFGINIYEENYNSDDELAFNITCIQERDSFNILLKGGGGMLEFVFSQFVHGPLNCKRCGSRLYCARLLSIRHIFSRFEPHKDTNRCLLQQGGKGGGKGIRNVFLWWKTRGEKKSVTQIISGGEE